MIFLRHKAAPRTSRAFTLTEILVVLALFTVLASLALLGLQAASRRARSVQAQNHLRMMSTAVAAYVAEHRGHLPSGANGTRLAAGELNSSQGPAVAFWFNALDYYLGGTDYTLTGMRSIERPRWQQDLTKIYQPTTGRRHGLYGIAVGFGWNHQYFGFDAQPSNAIYGWNSRMSEVEHPARTIIIGTGEDSDNPENLTRNIGIYANSIRCRRHNGGGYYLFLDGHLEKLTPEEVMANQSYLMRKKK